MSLDENIFDPHSPPDPLGDGSDAAAAATAVAGDIPTAALFEGSADDDPASPFYAGPDEFTHYADEPDRRFRARSTQRLPLLGNARRRRTLRQIAIFAGFAFIAFLLATLGESLLGGTSTPRTAANAPARPAPRRIITGSRPRATRVRHRSAVAHRARRWRRRSVSAGRQATPRSPRPATSPPPVVSGSQPSAPTYTPSQYAPPTSSLPSPASGSAGPHEPSAPAPRSTGSGDGSSAAGNSEFTFER